MAHYAELNENNEVVNVIVVRNEVIVDSNGNESEEIGQRFCHDTFGGSWIQTSYNSNFRGKLAKIGDIYLPEEDVFVTPSTTDEVQASL